MGCKSLRRCRHGSVTEMNFLQSSFMVCLYWSLYKGRDREYVCIDLLWMSRTPIWWFNLSVLLNIAPGYLKFLWKPRVICALLFDIKVV